MSENAVPPEGADLLTPYLRKNFPFLTVLPDWLWLLLGWMVTAVAAFLMYSAIKSEEAKLA